MGASVCPRPLSFVDNPAERHFTLDLPHGGATCEQAEAEANTVSAEVTAAVGLGQLCDSITPESVDKIARSRPEAKCSSGSHGVWTLALSEAGSWPAAVRGCLRRCANCARCRYITVSPAHSLCMWHHSCSAETAREGAAAKRAPWRAPRAPPPPPSPPTVDPESATACGFRSGRVLRRRKTTVALIFFGKFGNSGRSSHMSSSDNASVALIERTHAAFKANLLEPNANMIVEIFAHSWSPEAAEVFDTLWGPLLVKSLHEPTLLADSTTNHLAIQCLESAGNCERTASQLLSVRRAVALRSEHELFTGIRYDLTIVARNDLYLRVPYALPAALLGAGTSNNNELWLPTMCVGPSTCQVADGYAVPKGCIASGRGCFGKAEGHNYGPYLKAGVQMLGTDWLFAGGSESTSRMADAALRFHELVRVEARESGDSYVSTHFMWPYHAATSGLKLRWGLQLSASLTRSGAGNGDSKDETAFRKPRLGECYDNGTTFELNGRYTGFLLPGMEGACPYERVLVCEPQSSANRACSPSPF